MSLQDAQNALKTVEVATKGKFKPLAEPTLTARGARIEFERVTVDPIRVVEWFKNCGLMVTMIGYDGVYGREPFMVLEFRL